MVIEFKLNTPKEGFINITHFVKEAVQKSGVKNGICTVFCPHTTAGITINENADPDVLHDMLLGLSKTFPDMKEFRHFEGNSTAHLKSSFVGTDKNIIVSNEKLILGTWQSVYFCEFDGPRNRKFYVSVI